MDPLLAQLESKLAEIDTGVNELCVKSLAERISNESNDNRVVLVNQYSKMLSCLLVALVDLQGEDSTKHAIAQEVARVQQYFEKFAKQKQKEKRDKTKTNEDAQAFLEKVMTDFKGSSAISSSTPVVSSRAEPGKGGKSAKSAKSAKVGKSSKVSKVGKSSKKDKNDRKDKKRVKSSK